MIDHLPVQKILLNNKEVPITGNVWIPEPSPYFKDYLWYLNLARRTRDVPVDIIHNATQFYTRGKFRQKYVMTCMDTIPYTHPEYMNPLSRIYGRLLPGAAKTADRIICISRNTERDLIKAVPKTEGKTTVIYPGISPIFKPDPSISRNFNMVLYVGSIDPRKNVEMLIQAFAELKDDYSLWIAGRYGWGNSLTVPQLAAKWGVLERTYYLGYVPASVKLQLYNMATVLVYPSLYEGFGLPPVEAMACGCPVIAFDNSSLPEACGNAALLVKNNNFKHFVALLMAILEEESWQRGYSKLGIQNAAKFNWSDKAKEIMKVYEEVLSL